MTTAQSIQVKRQATEQPEERAPVRTPFVDIHETEAALIVKAELPGVAQEDVELVVEKGVLTIRGKAASPDLSGYSVLYEGMPTGGAFFRAFALSDEVDRDKASASMKDGILTVTLPKAAEARTRKIRVEPG